MHPADLGNFEVPPLNRLPDRFLRLLKVAVERGIVTRGDAAHTVGVSVEEINKLVRPDRASEGEEEALRDLAEAVRLRSRRAAQGAG